LGPKLFGLAKEHPSQIANRTLTLLAKTIQNLGNLVEFGQKETYMKDMNPFILDSKDRMKKYIDELSVCPLKYNNSNVL
jgi:Ras GTPase-activating protein 1